MEETASQARSQDVDCQEDPQQSSMLAGTLETLAELSEIAAGSEGLQGAFWPEGPPSDNEAAENDVYDWGQLDFGSQLGDDAADVRLREEMRRFVEQRLRRVRLRPTHILLRDKLTFVLGMTDLWVSAYWLGFSPQSFYRLYTAKAMVLFMLRWIIYRLKRWHYYLFDFCYAAQVLLLVQLWAYPTSVTLAKVAFAFNMGPLLWSIIAFRNSLVMHSLDKVTSHFLHFFPACVSWATRWHTSPGMQARLESSPAVAARWERAQLWDLCLLPMLFYSLWAVLYYAKVFVVSSRKIQQRGYDTLFKFSTKHRNSLFGAVVLRAPQKLQPLVYMAMHMMLAALTMVFNTLWWSSYTACTAFILAVFAWSAYNGATFYFDVFAHRYIASLGLEGQRSRQTPSGSQQHQAAGLTSSTASQRRKAE